MSEISEQNNDSARRAGMRRPLRQRGKQRVEILLDATETLLVEEDNSDISLALIATQADVPLPSIYHFFPNKNAILVALAERYRDQLHQLANQPLDPPPISWQEIVRRRQVSGACYLNAHPAALRLFLGAGVSADIRSLDLSGNSKLAVTRAEEFQARFDCSGITDFEDKIAISIALTDGIWAMSWSRHRQVTDECLTESVQAATAYLRCFLPEVLRPTHVAGK